MCTKRALASSVQVGPATAGLIIGAPEHDFSRDKTHYYYNNNVWSLVGMEELGKFLTDDSDPDLPTGRNATLGAALLADAAKYRSDLLRSIATCSVRNATEGSVFLPVYAELNASVPESMHADAASSYANFRFYSEPMLTGSSVVPAAIQQFWLTLHNSRGGRLGGASRWESHLDDMPTAGWGFGALVNNQTDDFLELLYGHMATYQSRGSFHSTEQLSFLGSGRYRGFCHIKDPPPGPDSAPQLAAERVRTQYNGAENDISFCIVSNILMARMTAWQMVLEDDGAIWLGRGAPKRWFRGPDAGFNVSSAPTSVGRVSFAVRAKAAGHATYTVQLLADCKRGCSADKAIWNLRWPGKIGQAGCEGCEVVATDAQTGIVSVRATRSTFSVDAAWS